MMAANGGTKRLNPTGNPSIFLKANNGDHVCGAEDEGSSEPHLIPPSPSQTDRRSRREISPTADSAQLKCCSSEAPKNPGVRPERGEEFSLRDLNEVGANICILSHHCQTIAYHENLSRCESPFIASVYFEMSKLGLGWITGQIFSTPMAPS